MRPLFLGRGWRIRRFVWWAGYVLWMLMLWLAIFWSVKILYGLSRILSQVCP